jgi:hybrid cluster-associated redox disulfide protein
MGHDGRSDMKYEVFSDLTVREIMLRWPSTIGVFIDLHLHCIGCPIGVFHTLADAAHEHGIELAELVAEVSVAIDTDTRAGPARLRRRSSSGDGRP